MRARDRHEAHAAQACHNRTPGRREGLVAPKRLLASRLLFGPSRTLGFAASVPVRPWVTFTTRKHRKATLSSSLGFEE